MCSQWSVLTLLLASAFRLIDVSFCDAGGGWKGSTRIHATSYVTKQAKMRDWIGEMVLLIQITLYILEWRSKKELFSLFS